MSKKSIAGFTLIELSIVVAIIGILAAVAYPAYQDSVLKGKRADAQSGLLQAMALQERYFSDKNKYTTALTNLGYGADSSVDSPDKYYKITATACDAGIESCVLLTAVPNVDDPKCKNLTFNSKGEKDIAGGGSGVKENCW